jgi:lysozyme family protein
MAVQNLLEGITMAKLEVAMPYVKTNEGEFANIAGDAGGETLDGIARKMHPEWPGWAILDKLNLPIHDARACDIIINQHPEIEPLVDAFYLKSYWCYDGLQSQNVATKLLDGAVNMEGDGKHGAAVKALQLAILQQKPGALNPDANYGPTTEKLANSCEPIKLLKDIARFYVAHYEDLIAHNSALAKFRADWERRAEKLPQFAEGAAA